MSTVTYRHEQNHSYKKKGVKHTIKEKLTDGEFLTLSFLKKVGDDEKNFYKLTVKETAKDKFSVREKKGASESEKEMSLKDFLALLKKEKDLAFAVTYMTKERGTYKAKYLALKNGTKKVSKKVSKKSLKGGANLEIP